MDPITLQLLTTLHDQRKAAADAKLAEWAENGPPLDGDGNPIRIGEPLVNVPLEAHRALCKAARPLASDGPADRKALEELAKGARRADGFEVAIYLRHLKFLLDRAEAE